MFFCWIALITSLGYVDIKILRYSRSLESYSRITEYMGRWNVMRTKLNFLNYIHSSNPYYNYYSIYQSFLFQAKTVDKNNGNHNFIFKTVKHLISNILT